MPYLLLFQKASPKRGSYWENQTRQNNKNTVTLDLTDTKPGGKNDAITNSVYCEIRPINGVLFKLGFYFHFTKKEIHTQAFAEVTRGIKPAPG